MSSYRGLRLKRHVKMHGGLRGGRCRFRVCGACRPVWWRGNHHTGFQTFPSSLILLFRSRRFQVSGSEDHTAEARKLEHGHPPIPRQRKKDNQHKSSCFHVPTERCLSARTREARVIEIHLCDVPDPAIHVLSRLLHCLMRLPLNFRSNLYCRAPTQWRVHSRPFVGQGSRCARSSEGSRQEEEC